MLKKVKSAIESRSAVSKFADAMPMSRTTLYNFLNGKSSLRSDILFKMLNKLDMSISCNGIGVFTESEYVTIEGAVYSTNKRFKGKKIIMCFSVEKSLMVFLLLQDNEGNHELKSFENV